MDEKGIIKFRCFHQESMLSNSKELDNLIQYRNIAYRKGYIGVYPNGIGYGNISIRVGKHFLISGSTTGIIPLADENHFSLVTNWDFSKNQVWCMGIVKASSESLTHAVIYEVLPEINAVLHIHSPELWEKYYYQLHSTSLDVEYGTPEMAFAVKDLILSEKFDKKGIFLMQGHEDGIVVFANSLGEVFIKLDELISQ